MKTKRTIDIKPMFDHSDGGAPPEYRQAWKEKRDAIQIGDSVIHAYGGGTREVLSKTDRFCIVSPGFYPLSGQPRNMKFSWEMIERRD